MAKGNVVGNKGIQSHHCPIRAVKICFVISSSETVSYYLEPLGNKYRITLYSSVYLYNVS